VTLDLTQAGASISSAAGLAALWVELGVDHEFGCLLM
jgi:hypothetical protein